MDIPAVLFLGPNRVWRTYPGGRILDQMEGKPNPEDTHFPEDWIGSTTRAVNKGREHLVEEGLSRVTVDGRIMTLKSLFERFPEAMLGSAHIAKYGTNTQFLLKFLDSAIRLHIQCHPTIPFARKYLNSNNGKTEAYVILGIRDGVKEPYIYMGFQHPPEVSGFKRMIEQQDTEAILACFEKIPIRAGDVFVVPGGMPHAIGEGVFMIEIMEPTDFVVRVEFERGGYVLPEESRFMNRGIDFAMSMFSFEETPVQGVRERFFCEPRLLETQNNSGEYALVDESKTPCFRVSRIVVGDQFVKNAPGFYIGIVTSGSGTIHAGNECWQVVTGSRFLVPARTGEVTFQSDTAMEIIATFPPG